jgi:hypothetical protein
MVCIYIYTHTHIYIYIYIHTYIYIIFSLYIHQLLGTSADSQFGYCGESCSKHGYRCLTCTLTYTSLDICQTVLRQGHKVGLFLVFLWTFILISIVVALVYIPTNSVWGFFFHTSLPELVICFHDGQSDWDGIES